MAIDCSKWIRAPGPRFSQRQAIAALWWGILSWAIVLKEAFGNFRKMMCSSSLLCKDRPREETWEKARWSLKSENNTKRLSGARNSNRRSKITSKNPDRLQAYPWGKAKPCHSSATKKRNKKIFKREKWSLWISGSESSRRWFKSSKRMLQSCSNSLDKTGKKL